MRKSVFPDASSGSGGGDHSNQTLRADGRGVGYYSRKVSDDTQHRRDQRVQGPRLTMDKRAKDGGNFKTKR